MTAYRLCYCAAMAAGAASFSIHNNRAYADGAFRFSPFSSSPSSPSTSSSETDPNPVKDPKGDSSGLDPSLLERGAKALRQLNSNRYAKEVIKITRKQEETRLLELDTDKAGLKASQAGQDIERQRKMAEEQLNLLQRQAQAKAQNLRHEDDLARKRMQTEHESQRRQNVELIKMQEESSIRKEQARRATEEQIQAQQRQTEKERAEIDRETIRIKAMVEAEARAHEAKLTEDHNKRMLVERIKGEREKWLAAINTMFSHIEGIQLILYLNGVDALLSASDFRT